MLTLLAMMWLASAPAEASSHAVQQPAPRCISSQGRTVCGFQCRSSGTDAACAQTPYGVCQSFGGRVYCWDPSRTVIHHPASGGSRPECKESRGQVACGYNCRISNGEVACNSTPYGVCSVHFGRLVCWDPPESVIHEYGSGTPQPRCVNASEAVACGYDCKTARAEVRCASTPRGVCRVDNGQFTCFDPPSLLHCDHSGPPAQGD